MGKGLLIIAMSFVAVGAVMVASVASCNTEASSTPKLHLTLGNDARLQYSAEAIAKLGMRLDVIRSRTRVVVEQKSGVR